MPMFEIIKRILERKTIIISIFFLTAFIVGIYEWRTPAEYESSVKFFIEEDNLYTSDLNVMHSSSQNRLFYFIKSNEMFDYLIEKFQLYLNYNIDTPSFLHYENICGMLNENIEVKTDIRNAIIVTVKDHDRFLAAAMANEIFKKVTEMNRDFVISVVKKKINIYEQIVQNARGEVKEQTTEFNRLIEECKRLIFQNQFQKNDYSFAYEMKSRLNALSGQLDGINTDFLKNVKIYEISLASIQKENITDIRLINIALADTSNPLSMSFLKILASSVAAVLIVILGFILFFEYKNYFTLIFSK
jgi:hypothetical protein